jgi:uncharacterized protein (DUF1778 family)
MTKKNISVAGRPRPDLYSKKRSGYIKTGVRLTVAENKLCRRAATLEGMSWNFWAMRVLVKAAKERIAEEGKADGV